MHISVAGENALIIYFGESSDTETAVGISSEIAAQVQHAAALIRRDLHHLLIDLVPSYASLLVIYDLHKTDHHHVRHQLRQTLSGLNQAAGSTGQIVSLPVYYSQESGPDLAALAERARLTIDEVIEIHQQQEYRVYAIGFAPGFAYLGEVDARIAAPRLATPRLKVPRGAVAIADRQTAVYPAVSPGGWNLIGLCPTRMFAPTAEPCMPVQVGDRVRFEAISRERFIELGGDLDSFSAAPNNKGAK
ncbi:MAG: KipI family sensor histidine kinase inhibitor [Motiliproteus sp.]|jgi:KipI family sensor histidine kinase inhibitor